MSATKPNYCCLENDIASKDMASEVFPRFICIFVLLTMFSRMISFQCEAFVISRPPLGKILFLTKNSLPAITLFCINLWYWKNVFVNLVIKLVLFVFNLKIFFYASFSSLTIFFTLACIPICREYWKELLLGIHTN